MISARRVLIATVVGLVLGVLLWLLAARTVAYGLPGCGAAAIVLSLAVAGFVVGISGLRWTWLLHGLLLGGIALLPLSLAGVWAGLKWWPGFVVLLVGGLIGGFLIELITAVIFRARAGQAAL
jgi:hypothetical protein